MKDKYIFMLCGILLEVEPELIIETFEERAGIREFEGGFTREIAEQLAFTDTLFSF